MLRPSTLARGRNTGPYEIHFTVYRQVPFLDDRRFDILGPEALESHVRAVRDTNRRLQVAGEPTVKVPEWVIRDLRLDDHEGFTYRDVQVLRGDQQGLDGPPVRDVDTAIGPDAGGTGTGPVSPEERLGSLRRSTPPPDLSL